MRRILLVSIDVNPNLGSEAGKAHNWLLALAEHFEVDVFVHSKHRKAIEQFGYPNNIRFLFAHPNPTREKSFEKFRRYDRINRLFIDKIEEEFYRMLNTGEIELVHFLTPAGLHSYNTLYKKQSFPYIIGPLGGGLSTPRGFGNLFSCKERIGDILRHSFYTLLKLNPNYKAYLRNAKKIIVGTEYLIDYLPRNFHSKTIVHFDTLVNMDEFKICEKSVRVHSHAEIIRIVFSGRLASVKGVELLVEAVRIALERYHGLNNRLQVDIFGDGPKRSKVESKLSDYGLREVVHLHGAVPKMQVIEALCKADIYCLPTIREPGGNAILEAMASGLPIITSDYGGPKFSVTDDCGIKIPVDNFDDYVSKLADAIAKLASDESLRKKMGESARKRVRETFSLDALKANITNIYSSLLFD